jgi:mRNA interferase MazF
MQKNFDIWNTYKKEIEDNPRTDFVNKRDIWWCCLGVNIGSEQDGVGEHFERPVIVLRKLSSTTFVVFPLSTKKKLEDFQYEITINGIIAYVLLDQIKVVDLRRFVRKMGYMNKIDFENVVEKFISLLYKTKDPSCEGSISEAEAAVV